MGAIWAVMANGLRKLTRNNAGSITLSLLWRFIGEVVVPTLPATPA